MAIGTMTGTSIDALDVAIARIHGCGLEMTVELVAHGQTPMGELEAPLRAAADQTPMTATEFARLAHRFGSLHAKSIQSLTNTYGVTPDLICLHGQTVAHEPPAGWALLDTAPLLPCFRCPIVTDLRLVDMAHGGQGAPITPLADWILFRGETPRVIVNLGGFCNITRLPGEEGTWKDTTGRDVCPCNHLLDGGARRWLNQPMDPDGHHAMKGAADQVLALRLADELGAKKTDASDQPRALAQGDEGGEFLQALQGMRNPDDRLATLSLALATRISDAAAPEDELVLFGGGALNQALVKHLTQARNGAPVRTGLNGVSLFAREALAMAVLGACASDELSITMNGTTSRRDESSYLDGKWHLTHH